jgi:TolB protein
MLRRTDNDKEARMRIHPLRSAFWIAFLLILLRPVAGFADIQYIDITNPFLRKLPIAIPVFQTVSETDTSREAALEGTDMLSEALAFTGYFQVLHRDSHLLEPGKTPLVAADINFPNWTAIGAEMLITGGLLVSGDTVEAELRLYDTFNARMLVGKRYKGWREDLRRIIHRFCGEVMLKLVGSRGIFGSKIAFVSTGTGNSEIFIADFDGHAPRQFTHTGNITLSPAWSSDGEWIAYTAYPRNNPGLFIKHRTQKRGAVFNKGGVMLDPCWVPGRFELAATLSFEGDPEIYLLTGTGKTIKRLTNSRDIDISPAWSPDGRQMAFVSKRSGTPQIYIKNVESGQVRRLTFQGRYNQQPSWSPNGDKIAYTGMEDGAINIYVIGVDGDGLLQLTRDAGDNESASWSPDGSLIVFSSTREGVSRLYVMTAYGTDQRRLLTMPGEQKTPAWSPRTIED